MRDKQKVYIAGAISATDPVEYLRNVNFGLSLYTFLIGKGFNPFWGGIDLLAVLNDCSVSLEDLQRNSMRWLEVSDVVVALPSCKDSKGAQAELQRAQDLNIPIVEFEWKNGAFRDLRENLERLLP